MPVADGYLIAGVVAFWFGAIVLAVSWAAIQLLKLARGKR